jgi:hypothetical protein
MIQRSRKWVVYEQGWRQTYKKKFCEGCHRTWPAKTEMHFTRGRWEYRRFKSNALYVWLCPVCRKFAVNHRGWDDSMVPQMCISLNRNARKPWWEMYPKNYKQVEAAYGLEVLGAGLDPVYLLIKKAGCHARSTTS